MIGGKSAVCLPRIALVAQEKQVTYNSLYHTQHVIPLLRVLFSLFAPVGRVYGAEPLVVHLATLAALNIRGFSCCIFASCHGASP